jgi:membrane fusion protein (multidrug efflux system)
VSEGRAQRVSVQLGERGGEFVEVRDGLAAGDTVVLYPNVQLREGARIKTK